MEIICYNNEQDKKEIIIKLEEFYINMTTWMRLTLHIYWLDWQWEGQQ